MTAAIVGLASLATLAAGQPGPAGAGHFGPGPALLPELVEAVAGEMEWLAGLPVEAPGWQPALTALEAALTELEAAEGAPAAENVVQMSAALHLVVGVLERTALEARRDRVRDGGAGPAGWLEGYLDEVTRDMPPEGAAQVRAAVRGLFLGLRDQADRPGARRAGPPSPRLSPERRQWVEGYLQGVTAGMGQEQARRVRTICWEALERGRGVVRDAVRGREDALRHVLRLRRIAAGLDVYLLGRSEGGSSQ